MSRILGVLFLFAFVVVAGCRGVGNGGLGSGVVGDDQAMTGVVSYIDLEGGFWAIEADDGSNYYPLNLDSAFHEDGLRVRFTFRLTPAMTTAQWGKTITIDKISKE